MRKEVRDILGCALLSILMFVIGFKNPLFWIVSLSAICGILSYLFKMKNWTLKVYYVASFPVFVAMVLVLVYTYLFRTVYLHNLMLNVTFVLFVVIVIMEISMYVYVYYLHRRRTHSR